MCVCAKIMAWELRWLQEVNAQTLQPGHEKAPVERTLSEVSEATLPRHALTWLSLVGGGYFPALLYTRLRFREKPRFRQGKMAPRPWGQESSTRQWVRPF